MVKRSFFFLFVSIVVPFAFFLPFFFFFFFFLKPDGPLHPTAQVAVFEHEVYRRGIQRFM